MEKYNVVRTYTQAEYCEVYANSEKEALRIAKELPEECWETDSNSCIDCYEYNAELSDEI